MKLIIQAMNRSTFEKQYMREQHKINNTITI